MKRGKRIFHPVGTRSKIANTWEVERWCEWSNIFSPHFFHSLFCFVPWTTCPFHFSSFNWLDQQNDQLLTLLSIPRIPLFQGWTGSQGSSSPSPDGRICSSSSSRPNEVCYSCSLIVNTFLCICIRVYVTHTHIVSWKVSRTLPSVTLRHKVVT